MHRLRLLQWLLPGALVACAHGGRPPSTVRAVVPTAVIAAQDAAPTAASAPALAAVELLDIDAPAFAPDPVRIAVHLPAGYDPAGSRRYPVVYLNDGQDAVAVDLQPTLARLHARGLIHPVIVVAIHMLPDRMGTYGLSDRAAARSLAADTRHGRVGARAHEYSEWVAKSLVPHIDARYRTLRSAGSRAVLGWSLGALNAFTLGWQYPELFGRVGAFSPSLWLSSQRADAAAVQQSRLAQAMVGRSEPRPGLKLFFAVGSAEETDDRDGDGINDAVDDTRDLILGYGGGADPAVRGLAQLGYSTNLDHASRPTRADVALLLLEAGEHNQASWARMLPAFLRWAYGRHAPVPAR